MKAKDRVLVVDDDKIVREVIAEICRDLGFFVDISTDGIDAIEKVEKNYYAIIFLDINMPGLNGYEVTEQILSIQPNLPIVVISGSLESNLINQTLAMGAKEAIYKPFTPDQIKETIFKYCDKVPPLERRREPRIAGPISAK